MAYTVACACGAVEFELTGAPIYQAPCCCNDCVTSAVYVDTLAATHAAVKISALERGNAQAADNVLWPAAGIRLVKGADKIAYFKLRSSSSALHTYTTCCYTKTIMFAGGHPFNKLGVGVPFNCNAFKGRPDFGTLKARINASEAVRRADLPTDDGVPTYSIAPLWALGRIVPKILWGIVWGRPPVGPADSDRTTSTVLDGPDPKTVTEVAGSAAYEAAGFKAPSM